MKTLIIAEAGVNHNGDIELAKQLIWAAKAAGADIVKFQSFKTAKLVTKTAEKATYQKVTTDAGDLSVQRRQVESALGVRAEHGQVTERRAGGLGGVGDGVEDRDLVAAVLEELAALA